MLVDYHIHTTLSGDSEQTIDTICQEAEKLGIKELCLTEHVDFEKGNFYYGRYDFEKVCENIKYAKEKYPLLTIRHGAEIDYQTQYLMEIYDFVAEYDIDFILGSIHKIRGVPVAYEGFYEGKTETEAWTEYFQTVREMICCNMFNCVAHIDFMKRGTYEYYGKFQPENYKEIICDALKEAIKRDMSLEINTNGYHWKDMNDFYPNIDILEWFRDLGGKYITYGSDSHKIGHLGTKINEMYDLIKSLGYSEIATYKNKIVKPVKI